MHQRLTGEWALDKSQGRAVSWDSLTAVRAKAASDLDVLYAAFTRAAIDAGWRMGEVQMSVGQWRSVWESKR